jgi:SAM-dependent methyltransferase
MELARVKSKGIALALISGRGFCPVEMLPSLAMQSWPPNTNFEIVTVYGKETDEGRIEFVKQARARNLQYGWFVDDDTVPPPEAGKHLLSVLKRYGPPNGKVMAVAGVYTNRASPPEPLVFKEQGAGPDYDWKVGEVSKRWGAGTGCMMINLEVFDYLPEPWFKNVNEAEHRWSDDLYFCDLLAQAGYELMIHGLILCHHYDFERGVIYTLPRNSQPYRDRTQEPLEPRLAAAVVTPAGKQADILHNPWMSPTETAWLISRAQESETFLEVGCWRGVTTRNVAKNSKAHVIAIDHFRGSDEHIDPYSEHYEPRLKNPGWLLAEARRNTEGLDVMLLEASSANAAQNFDGVLFDTVFIDASHDYMAVKRDIEVWLPRLSEKGVLCGHDFNWPDVRRAVTETLPSVFNIPGTSIWAYYKNGVSHGKQKLDGGG